MSDLSITAANVVADSGAQFFDGIAGATITAGQTVFQDSSDSKLKLADSNAAGDAPTVKGVALHGSANGQPLKIQIAGSFNPGATVAVGEVYVQSANPGGIAPAADLSAGQKVTIIGIGTAANKILLAIKNSGVAVPA